MGSLDGSLAMRDCPPWPNGLQAGGEDTCGVGGLGQGGSASGGREDACRGGEPPGGQGGPGGNWEEAPQLSGNATERQRAVAL